MKKGLATLLICVMVLAFCGCCLSHEWKDPTCAEPRTCVKCGKTEGSPLGHRWKAATCTEPKTCTVCGAAEGEPIEHTWVAATCTEPKTCSVCGTIEGAPLGHVGGDWTPIDSTSIGGDEQQLCSVCGEQIDVRHAQRGEKEYITVLTTSGLTMDGDEFVNHLINFLPSDYSIHPSGDGAHYSIPDAGWAGVGIIYGRNDPPSYKDEVVFRSKDRSALERLFEDFIEAIDPDSLNDSYYIDSNNKILSALRNHETASVPLHTGVCVVVYSKTTETYYLDFLTLRAAAE